MRLTICSSIVLTFLLSALADGPADNIPDNVRRIPPLPKTKLTDTERDELQKGSDELGREIESTRAALKGKPALLALLPDVQIFHNALRYAVMYDEIFDPKREMPIARELLRIGKERVAALKDGKSPWTTQTGLVVRGYVSKIDGSVQPYGLVVPDSFQPNSVHRHRLDVWCHGRGETLSELNFLNDRMKNRGQFTPRDAFVLHPYGRYCNANKFAGEIDCFEALEHIKKNYRIDDDRIVMRGFSMGGAACWQFAVHYPDRWCAAAPGAGFSETPEFLDVFQKEKLEPTWYEKKLWHLYDCPDYAVNLFNLPTVAYSGEIDRQKQAADVMEKALEREGIDLVHIIGPKTGHSYHPGARNEINRRIDAITELGRDKLPRKVKFQTYTLRYNRSFWVTIDAMEEHWAPARVEAEIVGDDKVILRTQNVAALTISIPPGLCTLDHPAVYFPPGKVIKDGTYGIVAQVKPASDRSWTSRWVKQPSTGRWTEVFEDDKSLRKRHGLQGPIDDAFLDRFIVVRPTGSPMNEAIGKWVDREMKHAIKHWRQQFRGEAIVKDDRAITDADVADSNLVLWGDPSSNAILAKIADRLPIKWTKNAIQVGDKTYKPDTHVPLLIYPNPLNSNRYVVLNSGFTFREYDYLNNARQVPKLPDYAIVDATTPMTSRAPGKVVEAGFFDEKWQIK